MALAIEMGMRVTSAMVRPSYQCNGKTCGNWEGNNHDDENCTCNGRSIGDADGNSNGNDDGNGKTVIIQKRTLFGCAQMSSWFVNLITRLHKMFKKLLLACHLNK